MRVSVIACVCNGTPIIVAGRAARDAVQMESLIESAAIVPVSPRRRLTATDNAIRHGVTACAVLRFVRLLAMESIWSVWRQIVARLSTLIVFNYTANASSSTHRYIPHSQPHGRI